MRRFGVEVEFGGSPQRALDELRAAGLTTDRSLAGYIGNSMTQWQIKLDASVPRGGELVSPPLDFDDPEQRGQVDRALKALQTAGCTTNRDAGIHVHVESRDLDARQLSAVARLFIKFEDCLFRLASSGWESLRPGAATYCQPLNARQKDGLARARSEQQVRTAYYGARAAFAHGHSHASRYCALNLHSHFYRGTIEFRLFNSSMNPARVQTYIAVCMALVQDARNGKIRSTSKSFPLGAMRSGQADEKKALFNFLQVLRYEAGMSLDDYRNVKRFWKNSRPQPAMSF